MDLESHGSRYIITKVSAQGVTGGIAQMLSIYKLSYRDYLRLVESLVDNSVPVPPSPGNSCVLPCKKL